VELEACPQRRNRKLIARRGFVARWRERVSVYDFAMVPQSSGQFHRSKQAVLWCCHGR
jgi:hypothetical protein